MFSVICIYSFFRDLLNFMYLCKDVIDIFSRLRMINSFIQNNILYIPKINLIRQSAYLENGYIKGLDHQYALNLCDNEILQLRNENIFSGDTFNYRVLLYKFYPGKDGYAYCHQECEDRNGNLYEAEVYMYRATQKSLQQEWERKHPQTKDKMNTNMFQILDFEFIAILLINNIMEDNQEDIISKYCSHEEVSNIQEFMLSNLKYRGTQLYPLN